MGLENLHISGSDPLFESAQRGVDHRLLSERSQKVSLDGRASDPVPGLSGVPQGSVLGPVLFLIFINDLPNNIRSSVRLFADDCVLYRNIKSPLDCQILQDDLNSLAKWETDWQMKFNVSKCHSMRVTSQPAYTIQLHTASANIRTGSVRKIPRPVLLSQMILIGVNIFPKLHARQLRLWVFFGAICHWHLGILRKLHTKHWFGLNLSTIFALSAGFQLIKINIRNTGNQNHPDLKVRGVNGYLYFYYRLFLSWKPADNAKIPVMKLRLLRWRRCRGLLPGGPAGDGGTPVASVKC